MLLQTTTATTTAVEKAFQTSPDTVYGILIGFLVLMLIASLWALRFIYFDNKKTNVEYRVKILELFTLSNATNEKVAVNVEKNTVATERNNQLLQTLIRNNNTK